MYIVIIMDSSKSNLGSTKNHKHIEKQTHDKQSTLHKPFVIILNFSKRVDELALSLFLETIFMGTSQ